MNENYIKEFLSELKINSSFGFIIFTYIALYSTVRESIGSVEFQGTFYTQFADISILTHLMTFSLMLGIVILNLICVRYLLLKTLKKKKNIQKYFLVIPSIIAIFPFFIAFLIINIF